MTDKTLGLSWLTERVTLLAQQLDKTLDMVAQLGANQKTINDTLSVQRESIAELNKKCDSLYRTCETLLESIEVLGHR